MCFFCSFFSEIGVCIPVSSRYIPYLCGCYQIPILLMNKLKALLKSPYPIFYQRWKAVIITSAVIFLILYVLQPFGISQIKNGMFGVVGGSALIAAGASAFFAYLLPVFFPAYYKEQNWTLGKHLLNLLQLLLLIAAGIWLYLSWWMGVKLDVRLFLPVLLWVAVLAPFPAALLLMWNRNMLLTCRLKEAKEMNALLSKSTLESRGTISEIEERTWGTLLFSGGTKESLEMAAEDFLYAEAEGNYVLMVYRSGGEETSRKLLRVTMKQAERAVEACPFIIRCHRAFLVNVRRVLTVSGNLQGYRLKLTGCEDEVPVSRAYARQVRGLIKDRLKR